MWNNENLRFAAGMLSILTAVSVFFNVMHGNGIIVGIWLAVLFVIVLGGMACVLGLALHVFELFSNNKDRR